MDDSQNPKYESIQNHPEFNALFIETIQRIKNGETIRQQSAYLRLMRQLDSRARQLEQHGVELPLKEASDWLALALFMRDRDAFHALCRLADQEQYPNYEQARPWLERLLVQDNDTKE